MTDVKKYLLHSSGFYNLIIWLAELKKYGMPCDVNNNIIQINPLFSKYLSFGISVTQKSGGDPFIAVPSQEARWMHMMEWSKIVFRKNDNYIYFITKSVVSPSPAYPDIPSFGLAFYVDLKDKTNLISFDKEIIIREYFQEDNNALYINYHNSVFKTSIENIPEDFMIPLDNNKDIKNYAEFLTSSINTQTSYGQRFVPY